MKSFQNSVWVSKMKISVFYEHIAEAAIQENKKVSDICKIASSFGIKGVEIENARLLREKEEVIKNLNDADMEISCMYGFFDFAHKDDVADGIKMIDLAEELHIKKVMLIPGFLKKYEFWKPFYQKKLDKMVNYLSEICTYAKEKNIMVVLEDFDDKIAPFATANQLMYFYNKIPGLYCAFDTGNFLYSEEDALEVLPLFIDRIGHVHCKDRTFTVKEGENPKATIKGRNMYSCAVGSGCIAMKEIVKTILKSGYHDYFSIEHFGSLQQLRDMEISAQWLMERASE